MFSDARVYNYQNPSGILLSDLGFTILKTSNIDILPKITNRGANVLGRPGLLVTGRDIEYRNINLDLEVSTELVPTTSSYYGLDVDTLLGLLEQNLINNNRGVEIEFTDYPNRFYKADYNNSQAPTLYFEDGTVSLSLICYDPYVYGPEEYINSLGQYKIGSGSYYTPTEEELESLVNDGDEIIEPTIEMFNMATPITIDIGDVSCSLEGLYNTELHAKIDSETGSVYQFMTYSIDELVLYSDASQIVLKMEDVSDGLLAPENLDPVYIPEPEIRVVSNEVGDPIDIFPYFQGDLPEIPLNGTLVPEITNCDWIFSFRRRYIM